MIVHGNSSGLIQLCISKLPSQVQKLNLTPKRANFSKAILVSTRIRTTTSSRIRCASYSARSYHELKTNDGSDSFWLSLTKEAIGGFRSLGVFLVVQPSQLRYIEWPSFRSTLKTASLTLVLVALLIVALSSIDSVLCYLLAVVLRRAA